MEHEKVINHHTNKRNAYKFQRLEQKEKNVNKLIERLSKNKFGVVHLEGPIFKEEGGLRLCDIQTEYGSTTYNSDGICGQLFYRFYGNDSIIDWLTVAAFFNTLCFIHQCISRIFQVKCVASYSKCAFR